MPTDIKEVIALLRDSIASPDAQYRVSLNGADLTALLDEADAGAKARDAALEECERIAEGHAKIGASTPADVLQDIRSLRRPG